jgi:TatA/E family protein of Tat protein translocase
MGPLGWQEMMLIFVLALLIFGPKKLPELGKTIGKAMTEFRRASSDFKSTWDREMINLERENESLKEVTSSVQNELNNYNPSSSYEDGAYDPYSYDSTAESPSTESASATEGAESTTAATPENGVVTAEAAGEEAGEATEAMAADTGEPGALPKPVGAAEGGSASEPRAVAG